MASFQNYFRAVHTEKNARFRKNFTHIFLSGIAFFGFMFSLSAQENYRLKSFQITVLGTSNLHDWQAKVGKAKGHCDCAKEDFREVFIAIESNSLQTEHSAMTKKIIELLKAEKHPEITFQSAEMKSVEKNNDYTKILVSGIVRIAGVSKKIEIYVQCKPTGANSFEAKLSFQLKMTDFGIEPPRAMLGALKTADEIKIDCVMNFTP